MKNLKNILKIFLVLFILCLVAFGLNKYFPQMDYQKSIIGNWELIADKTYEVSFFADGKVEEKLKTLFASGTWFLEEDNKKNILTTVMGEEKKYNIELLNSNNLVIIDSEGNKLEFERK